MQHTYEFKQQVIQARKDGLSYGEIADRFKLSKSTISLWCKNIVLKPEQINRIWEKTKSNWIYATEQRKKDAYNRKIKIQKKAAQEINYLTNENIFNLGIALYWGEGTKSDGDVAFSNSDTNTVKLMMRFFREICKVEENKFRGRLFIHPKEYHFDNKTEEEALLYWSEITKIPLSKFHKTNFYKSKPTSFKRGKIMLYGTLMIRVMDFNLHRKIMGWIKGISEKI